MKRNALSALLSVAAMGMAQAAIAPASTGNSELFLNVVDTVNKVSYALDLGMYLGLGLGANDGDASAFLVAAQQDIGYQRFWVVDSANWDAFLQLVSNPATLRWSVVAMDATGPLSGGTHRLLTTAKQGSESSIASLTNKQLTDGVGSTQGGQFFGTVNAKGSHVPQTDYAVNGDSYSLSTDNGFGYYGKAGGLTPTLNGNAGFDATNLVGQSSWAYYLLRSGSGQTSKVTIDEIDNLGADGYWGFVKVEDQDSSSPFYDPDSPYAGKYLLSFTMPVYTPVVTSAFREFALSIGRTEYGGGFQVSALGVAVAAAPAEQAAGWVTPLGVAGRADGGLPWVTPLTQQVSTVPEPGTWALWLAGSLGLAGLRRRGAARRLPG